MSLRAFSRPEALQNRYEADIDNVLGEPPAPAVRGPPQEAHTAQADTLRITDDHDLRVRVLEAKLLDQLILMACEFLQNHRDPRYGGWAVRRIKALQNTAVWAVCANCGTAPDEASKILKSMPFVTSLPPEFN